MAKEAQAYVKLIHPCSVTTDSELCQAPSWYSSPMLFLHGKAAGKAALQSGLLSGGLRLLPSHCSRGHSWEKQLAKSEKYTRPFKFRDTTSERLPSRR